MSNHNLRNIAFAAVKAAVVASKAARGRTSLRASGKEVRPRRAVDPEVKRARRALSKLVRAFNEASEAGASLDPRCEAATRAACIWADKLDAARAATETARYFGAQKIHEGREALRAFIRAAHQKQVDLALEVASPELTRVRRKADKLLDNERAEARKRGVPPHRVGEVIAARVNKIREALAAKEAAIVTEAADVAVMTTDERIQAEAARLDAARREVWIEVSADWEAVDETFTAAILAARAAGGVRAATLSVIQAARSARRNVWRKKVVEAAASLPDRQWVARDPAPAEVYHHDGVVAAPAAPDKGRREAAISLMRAASKRAARAIEARRAEDLAVEAARAAYEAEVKPLDLSALL